MPVVKDVAIDRNLSDQNISPKNGHKQHKISEIITVGPSQPNQHVTFDSTPPDSLENQVTESERGAVNETTDPDNGGQSVSLNYPGSSDSEQNRQNPILRVTRSEGMYVEAQVVGISVVFAIDTGASKTVISKAVYESIPESRRPALVKTTGLTGASGKPLRQYGIANFCLRLGSVEMNQEMIVADIEDEGLLGHDMLLRGNASIQYGDGTLRFNDISVPCIRVGGSQKAMKVRSADHFVIPSRSEAIIDVFVDGADTGCVVDNRTIIIEPSSTFQERYGVAMASSLSNIYLNVTHKVRLMNPNLADVSINQDVVVGTAEPIVGDPHVIISTENEDEIGNTKHVRSLKMDSCKDHKPLPQLRRVHQQMPDHLQQLYESASIDRTTQEKERIATTLINFADTFSVDEYDLGLTHLAEHCIDVGDNAPIKQPPRRVPIAFASEEENVIKQMEKQGIIRPSNSPWASPICLVKKKSGKIRPCVDFRKVNLVTRKDAYPLPRINDCLDAVAGACFFSTFDLTSGFHQIPINYQTYQNRILHKIRPV